MIKYDTATDMIKCDTATFFREQITKNLAEL